MGFGPAGSRQQHFIFVDDIFIFAMEWSHIVEMVADVAHVIEVLGSTVSLKKSRWTYNEFAFPESELFLPDGTPL